MFPYHEFRGSSHDVGRQHGTVLRTTVRQQVAETLDTAAKAGLTRDAALAWAQGQWPRMAELNPAWEEELHGLAEGAGITFAEAVALQVRPGTGAMPEGCTSVAIGKDRTADGAPLAGQNRDLVPSYRARMFVGRFRFDDGRDLLMHCVPGELAGVGLNGAGLCVFANSLWARAGRTWMAPPVLRRLALECRTAASAAERIGACSGPAVGNFLIADAAGEVRNLEILPEGLKVTARQGGVYIHTNHCHDPELQKFEVREKHPAPGSGPRQTRMEELLSSRPRISVADLQSAFSDTASRPEPICRTAADGDPLETTSTTIVEPATRTLHLSYGPPSAGRWAVHRVTG